MCENCAQIIYSDSPSIDAIRFRLWLLRRAQTESCCGNLIRAVETITSAEDINPSISVIDDSFLLVGQLGTCQAMDIRASKLS